MRYRRPDIEIGPMSCCNSPGNRISVMSKRRNVVDHKVLLQLPMIIHLRVSGPLLLSRLLSQHVRHTSQKSSCTKLNQRASIARLGTPTKSHCTVGPVTLWLGWPCNSPCALLGDWRVNGRDCTCVSHRSFSERLSYRYLLHSAHCRLRSEASLAGEVPVHEPQGE